MKHGRRARWAAGMAWAGFTFLVGACSRGGPAGPSEPIGEAESAVFANGSFEAGAAGTAPSSWTVNAYLNPGITVQTPQTYSGLNLATGGVANTVLLSAGGAGPGSQSDMAIGNLLTWPRYGQQCAIVNGPNAGNVSGSPNTNGANQNVNQLSQTMTIGAGDVDSADGQVHIRFAVAPVLMNPVHTLTQQPYYMVLVTNLTKGTSLHSDFNLSGAGIPWQSTTVNGNLIDYTSWQLVDVAPGAAGISTGDMIQLQILAAGCSAGAHWGEIYVDGVGPVIPGLTIEGAGPAQANPGAPISYTFTYRNGSPKTACTTSANCSPTTEACVGGFCAETGVTIQLTTPANTTFQSITPPAGATCSTLPVGGTGTITCSFTNPVSPGALGSFNLTVNVNGGATGTITCANYNVLSTQETALLGPPITTVAGCTADSQCSAGSWCKESANACTPTLANGVAMPTDPGHSSPVLNGACTVQAGALVCTSKVCDAADDDCGYKNGDGPCSASNAGTVCRSGVCDVDLKCGYANGDGTCTPGATGNGSTICRSGFCSNNDTCEPSGQCFLDADCSATSWCNETTHLCVAKLTNGTPVPTDPAHSNPTLDGTCTAANEGQVGPLVCQGGACDPTDGKCGIANGDPGCTPANGGTVCRSGACSNDDHCIPAGGCDLDSDCFDGAWCMETTHVCKPKLGNGVPLPVDGTHLSGACSSMEATLVCASGVCDTDNKCGYLNGDGSCTPGVGSPVCRSSVCDPDGKCGYANGDGSCTPGPTGNGPVVCRSTDCANDGRCVALGGCDLDSDCPAASWCLESTHTCMAKLANGIAMPNDPSHTSPTLNGSCTPAGAALVCVSGVCDPVDSKCGLANSDPGCTPGPTGNGGTVCRSGACSTNDTCEPAGGCNVDADCNGGTWCNETTHVCTARIPNGSPIPTDGAHTSPTLNGKCTVAAGILTCQSGVCDPTDDKCGLANGDPGCTVATGGNLCRSGACSVNGTCEPAGGCNVDADCATGNWCQETTHVCTARLANGSPVPTDGAHQSPTLNGTCTTVNQGQVGPLVCQSGVCDPKDNECGYANGDGPCTLADGGTVCRSGMCSTSGVCVPAGGCATDADCPAGRWCNESLSACVPTLANGAAVPSDPTHTSPTLTGTCTTAAGALTCTSGVCDTKDNECGYANGDGPCTQGNGDTVCRSQKCNAAGENPGLCVGCTMDSDCSGATPACNTTTGNCVQCTSSSQCSGSTPVCNTNTSACVACNGDNGSAASEPCPTMGSPFCFLSGAMAGQCGNCGSNADCQGHMGNVCDMNGGVCVVGCLVDTDCVGGDWCTSPDGVVVGTCKPKIANGQPLPSSPSSVSTCSTSVGARVCQSGVCDTDNNCGLAQGDGPCSNPDVCRSDMCDTTTMKCGGAPQCTTDSDCPSADFCNVGTGTCSPKLPIGQACTAPSQCQSDDCSNNVCSGVIGSGNGLFCATRQPGGSSGGVPAGLLGLVLAAAVARRRR